jgi:Rad3-related DNA helicase
MKPIDVAPILQSALFESKSIKAIVGTSATLTTAGNFDYVIGQLGAYQSEELVVPSPFDHEGKAVLIVPRDLPDPKHSLFAERVAEVVNDTIRIVKGRTLVLFTSYRVLDFTHKYLREQMCEYKIFRQGERPRTQLIDEFRNNVSSVLLGTASFWEGIDVQGESLSAVVIDRLPFEHPDDPVFEAICEKDPQGWFMKYALPKSVIEFRQGFGRLIRSRTDRGVIVVCDRRITDKPYGAKYLRSLPAGVKLERALEVAARILGG